MYARFLHVLNSTSAIPCKKLEKGSSHRALPRRSHGKETGARDFPCDELGIHCAISFELILGKG